MKVMGVDSKETAAGRYLGLFGGPERRVVSRLTILERELDRRLTFTKEGGTQRPRTGRTRPPRRR